MSLPELPDIDIDILDDQLSNCDLGLMLPIVNYSDVTEQDTITTITTIVPVPEQNSTNKIESVIDWSTLDYNIAENTDDSASWDSLFINNNKKDITTKEDITISNTNYDILEVWSHLN